MRPLRYVPIKWPRYPGLNLKGVHQEWRTIAKDYEKQPWRLGYARLYLAHHPAFWEAPDANGLRSWGMAFYRSIEHGVDPDTDEHWLEIQPALWPGDPTEEERWAKTNGVLSVAIAVEAPTYEELIVKAAELVHDKYGNDREFLKIPVIEEEGRWYG